jgi:branched-chain amino acid transport system substrate-binding protein
MTPSKSIIRMAAMAVAVASALGAGGAFAQGKEPLKIGIPTALSGPYGVISPEIKRAADFAVAEINAKGGADGRKVEYRMYDTEGKPDLARKQAEKLALEGFNVLTGTISSGEGLAMGPMLERWDAIYVNTFAKSLKLTGDSCVPRLFRVNQADGHDLAVIKPWLATRKEAKWAVVGLDAAWGREIGGKFKEAATAAGKTITGENYPAFGTNDFAPFIQQIMAQNADGVFVALSGRDAITFLKQAKQFGLLDKTTLGGVSINLDGNLRAVGDVAKGIWGNINYSASLDTPDNKRFVAAWKKFYNGDEPTDLEGEHYVAYQAIFQAVERAKSVKPVDIAKVLSGGSFETVFGKVAIRAGDNQMVLPNYFGQVTDVGGKMKNVVSLTVSPDQATPALDGSCKMGKL